MSSIEIEYNLDIGFWSSYTIDFRGNILIYKNSTGYWHEYAYDSGGKVLTCKDSTGKEISYG